MDATTPPACASPDGASPSQPLTPVAGTRTGRVVDDLVRDIDDSPVHGALEDREEQVVRHRWHDAKHRRVSGWQHAEGVSW
jgi:hypothetical protein